MNGKFNIFNSLIRTVSYVTGLKIQSGHGKEEGKGMKTFKIGYQQGKNVWNSNQEKIISSVWSSSSWEEFGVKDKASVTLLREETTPIYLKLNPILTDNIIIHILESFGGNEIVNVFINELALYNDCKLTGLS